MVNIKKQPIICDIMVNILLVTAYADVGPKLELEIC